jgi:hypothetical protein
MFGWIDARDAKRFGGELAAFYIAEMPRTLALTEKKFTVKTQETLRVMANRIQAFKAEHPLNGYKKAQLGNTFKWALRDAGYEPAYIDKLTDWLVTIL